MRKKKKKGSRHQRPLLAFLFQISYKQTPSIVVYLVPKQYRICCVHIGVWIYHSVYITCAYITHTYIHTHSYMYENTYSIYIQYNSQPHHAVTHVDSGVCWLNATGYFHFLHSIHQQTLRGCSFFWIEQEIIISLSHNLTDTQPAASEIPHRRVKEKLLSI